jgi:hypothetical protein
MRSDFAVFILTNRRAENVRTYRALRNCGYTGRICLFVDDEDPQLSEYRRTYGKEVVVFKKQDAIDYTDSCDNFGKRNSVVFARNWNFVVAKQMGLKYFWQLDDDYSSFGWSLDNEKNYVSANAATRSLDAVIDACLEFLETSGAKSVAFAQGGDFIGGGEGGFLRRARNGWMPRKVMNSFFFSVDRPVKFLGRINEDVNLYVEDGRRGSLFVTIPRLRLWQHQTQTNEGGLTDIYLDLGTYVKSFYTIICAPSCVKIITMGTTHRRLHHMVQWGVAVPKIVSEKYRKAA